MSVKLADEKKNSKTLDIGKCPLKHKWDFRTGSPQRMFRAIQDAIEDMGYSIDNSQPLELKSLPISDTATFTAEVVGTKKKESNTWLIMTGIICLVISFIPIVNFILKLFIMINMIVIMITGKADTTSDIITTSDFIWMVIGGILCVVGVTLISNSRRERILIGRLEGEVYKAAAKVSESAQTTDVVCDTRLTVGGGVAVSKTWVKDHKKQETLEADFKEIQKRVEAVLPSFIVDGNAAGLQAGGLKERPPYWTDNVGAKEANKDKRMPCCSKCGNKVAEGNLYCSVCGVILEHTQTPKVGATNIPIRVHFYLGRVRRVLAIIFGGVIRVLKKSLKIRVSFKYRP